MDDMQDRPRTAEVLERWRHAAGLSRQRLADLADVSATYVRTIEAGWDAEGRTVVPSPAIMRKLARGLARAGPDGPSRADREQHIYADLMAAAGYIAPDLPGPGTAPAEALTLRESPAHVSLPRSSERQGPLSVVLRDPRLWGPARDLFETWESLDRDDRVLLLGIMEFVWSRRGRAPARQEGEPSC